MQLAARTGAWYGENLPYDAEVEWIENDGAAYFTLPFCPDSTISVIVDVYAVRGAIKVFGSQLSDTENAFCLGQNTYLNGWWYVRHGNTNTYGIYQGGRLVWQEVTLSNGKVSFIPTHGSASIPRTTFESDIEIDLFAFNENGNHLTSDGALRMRKFIVLDANSKTVIDIVPVRIGNGANAEGAMYDRVSGQLFRNAGTGAFIIGPDKVSQLGGGITANA